MLTRSEGSLLLGEDVTLVSRGVSQWESADLRLRGRSEVQTAQSRMADHRTGGCRTDSAARSFLAEAEMGAVVVIIRRVCGEKPLEVALVQGDDVVEQIAPAAAYPAFRNTVLPGALD